MVVFASGKEKILTKNFLLLKKQKQQPLEHSGQEYSFVFFQWVCLLWFEMQTFNRLIYH